MSRGGMGEGREKVGGWGRGECKKREERKEKEK